MRDDDRGRTRTAGTFRLARIVLATALALAPLGLVARAAWAQEGIFSRGRTGLYVTLQEPKQGQAPQGQDSSSGGGGSRTMPQTGVGVEALGLLVGGALLAAGGHALLKGGRQRTMGKSGGRPPRIPPRIRTDDFGRKLP